MSEARRTAKCRKWVGNGDQRNTTPFPTPNICRRKRKHTKPASKGGCYEQLARAGQSCTRLAQATAKPSSRRSASLVWAKLDMQAAQAMGVHGEFVERKARSEADRASAVLGYLEKHLAAWQRAILSGRFQGTDFAKVIRKGIGWPTLQYDGESNHASSEEDVVSDAETEDLSPVNHGTTSWADRSQPLQSSPETSYGPAKNASYDGSDPPVSNASRIATVKVTDTPLVSFGHQQPRVDADDDDDDSSSRPPEMPIRRVSCPY